jgi:peptidoglycan/xylan/chitin deacetylase (PgdA/CDA1 family)
MTDNPKYHWLRKIILGFAVITPVWTIILLQFDWMTALAPLFVSHLFVLYPTLVPHSQWWGPVLRSFHTSGKEVWITIDDGPTPEHTERILDLLDRYHARATFFVIGLRAEKYPQLIRKILERGHEIANHTLTHPSRSFWCALESRVFAEIDGCDDAIGHEQSKSRAYFRAPAGLKNFFVHRVLQRRSMHLVGWTARGFDTGKRHPDRVAKRILKRVKPGAIVLLHEGHQLENDPDYNPTCLERTLHDLAELGYNFVIPRMRQLQTCAAGK